MSSKRNFLKKQKILLQTLSWKSILWNLGLISAGSIIFAAGLNSVLIPQKLLGGGLVGAALILHYSFPFLDVGLLYFVLNIPLAWLGWFNVSPRFMFYTLFGMAFFSFAANVIKPPPVFILDIIPAALLAGFVCGVGAGLILRSLGSAGGLDIIGAYLNKKFGLRVGPVMFAANSSVLVLASFLFGLDIVLYSIIYVYVSTRVIDSILTGFNRRKVMLVVSNKSHSIAREILERESRGVTFIKGEGAYSGQQEDIILTITSLLDLPKVKQLVFSIDPEAFVVVNDTLEVLGKRHGRGRVY